MKRASLVAQTVKNLPAMQETWVQSLDWKDALEKEMATHSCILVWEILWTGEPGGLQSVEPQRLRHNSATKQQCAGPAPTYSCPLLIKLY